MSEPLENKSQPTWIVHLCQSAAWSAALTRNLYEAASLAEEGFIHCSRPDQVVTVANRYYVGYTDLVLLWIDPNHLNAELRWESSDTDVFPHIYGALNLEAVQAVMDFPAAPDGHFYIQPEYPS